MFSTVAGSVEVGHGLEAAEDIQQQVFLQPSPKQSALENDMSEAAFVPKKLIVCLEYRSEAVKQIEDS